MELGTTFKMPKLPGRQANLVWTIVDIGIVFVVIRAPNNDTKSLLLHEVEAILADPKPKKSKYVKTDRKAKSPKSQKLRRNVA
jgi:hypothetical protein